MTIQETNALMARGVCKAYGQLKVLDGLDLTVEPGKIYGLIGRNGAGKTTLLSILTAQNTLDAGEVTYGGQPVWENQWALDHLCFSRELQPARNGAQNPQKVRDYLRAAAAFLPRWDREYAARLLEEFRLEPRKKIGQLSKGQMSMVTILVALASRAPVTILDEPVAGLDVVMRERFYRLLLDDYAETGRTFILSTHIIEEAASVFEEVLILDRGKIVEHAPTEELVGQFAYLSGAEEELDRACAGLRVLSEERVGRRTTRAVRGTPEALEAAGAFDVDLAPMNLQNVFVALCGHGDER